MADRANQIINTPQTLFTTGSITKMFTAVAILQLEEKGLLSTDDRLSKFFVSIPKDKSNISIHDLLTHGAGFPGAIGDDYVAVKADEFLQLAFSENCYLSRDPIMNIRMLGFQSWASS